MDTRTSRFALALALLSFSLIGAGCVAAGGDEDQVDLSGAPLGERQSAAYVAPNEVDEPGVTGSEVNEPDVTGGTVNEPDVTGSEVNEPDVTGGTVNEPDVSSLARCPENDVNCDATSEQ